MFQITEEKEYYTFSILYKFHIEYDANSFNLYHWKFKNRPRNTYIFFFFSESVHFRLGLVWLKVSKNPSLEQTKRINN